MSTKPWKNVYSEATLTESLIGRNQTWEYCSE